MGRRARVRYENSGELVQPLVGIVMGSASDHEIMNDAATLLERFAIPFEIHVVSAHRTPEAMIAYGLSARGRGLKVLIAGAGGAAHLPGMLAAVTTLPVIGVPVGTVAINGATNAGLLCARILSLGDAALSAALEEYRLELVSQATQQDRELPRS